MASFGSFIALSLTLNDLYINVYETSSNYAVILSTFLYLARIPGGIIADHYRATKTLLGGLLITSFSWIVSFGSPHLLVFMCAAFVGELAMGTVMTATYKIIPTLFRLQVGAVNDVVGSLGSFAGFFLPSISGSLSTYIEFQFGTVLAVILINIFTLLNLLRLARQVLHASFS